MADEWLLYVGAFVVGVAAQGSKICVDTIVQESVDDAFRGRVFSFYDVIFNIAFVSAAAFGALALPADGYSPAVYAVIAIGYADHRGDVRPGHPPAGRARTGPYRDDYRPSALNSPRSGGNDHARVIIAGGAGRSAVLLGGPPAAQLGLGVLGARAGPGRGAPP